MRPLRESLEEALSELRSAGLERCLSTPEGIDFSSNDYLGLTRLPEYRDVLLERLLALPSESLTAPASRLLRGHLPEHASLEEELARYKGTEAALLFSTGYQANLGTLSALIEPADRVLSDELNHASIIDGLRLSRARKVIYPHLALDRIEEELARGHDGGRTFVITESLFSMEGDVAPLVEIADLCDRHGAELIVDDAHATGLYGKERGSGLTELSGIEERVAAIVSTFGKALGVFGAFVAGPRTVIDWLMNRARSFVFTTAPPPLVLCAMETSLELSRARPELRARALALADRLRAALRKEGLDCLESSGPIVPVIIGTNEKAMSVAAEVRERGFDVRAIRPPSVPPGTARLRVSVHAEHSEDPIDRLAAAIAEACRDLRAGRCRRGDSRKSWNPRGCGPWTFDDSMP